MKVRLSSIEIMGFAGLFIILFTYIVRKSGIVNNSEFNLFWFTPNFGGAWFITALIKQFFKPVGNNKPIISSAFSILNYSLICFAVVILAILNEFAYPLNTSGTFDIADV